MASLAVEQLALEVFENKESYKNIDFIVIMNILMEEYHTIKGLPPVRSKEHKCENDCCCNVLYEDGLCWECWNLRELEEGSDNDGSDSDDSRDTVLDIY